MAGWKSEAFVVLILCSKCKLAMHQLMLKRWGGEFSKIARRRGPSHAQLPWTGGQTVPHAISASHFVPANSAGRFIPRRRAVIVACAEKR